MIRVDEFYPNDSVLNRLINSYLLSPSSELLLKLATEKAKTNIEKLQAEIKKIVKEVNNAKQAIPGSINQVNPVIIRNIIRQIIIKEGIINRKFEKISTWQNYLLQIEDLSSVRDQNEIINTIDIVGKRIVGRDEFVALRELNAKKGKDERRRELFEEISNFSEDIGDDIITKDDLEDKVNQYLIEVTNKNNISVLDQELIPSLSKNNKEIQKQLHDIKMDNLLKNMPHVP